MPEYLAPGVYVEETSFSAPTIEGVSTTTTGFAGPTLTGPVSGTPYGGLAAPNPAPGPPPLLTSFGDFQNIYGQYNDLEMTLNTPNPDKNVNYMAMAVWAFFANGGSEVYVSRVCAGGAYATSGTASTSNVVVAARFPGAFLNSLNVTVTLTAKHVNNFNNLPNMPPGTLLGTPGTGGGSPTFYTNGTGRTFNSNASPPVAITSTAFPANLYVLTVNVSAPGANGSPMVFNGLGLDPNNYNYLGDVLGSNPPRPIDALQNQIWFEIGNTLTPVTLFSFLFPTWNDPSAVPATPTSPFIFTLANGSDGSEPKSADYTTPFQYLAALEDIAIVATPGASIYDDSTNIMIGAVIPHVSAQRAYRVAILEAGPGLTDAGYQNVRAGIDTSYAALYVPWVWTPNPLAAAGTSAPSQIKVPPSGAIAGIYGRNDVEYSVAKAPANEVVLGAADLERHINFAEQQLLNPLGINCLRYFPDRGFRVWGARTVSSDTSLMYINVRRYLIYLEHSIDNGTQWAVFQNNGPMLWARVKDSIDSFLNNEFAEGNLLGSSPSQAYFVRCDRTTMTQNDLDNGRMICVIGVALLKPAEFVIFRIGQMTASAQS